MAVNSAPGFSHLYLLGCAKFTLDLKPPTAGHPRPSTVQTRDQIRAVLSFLKHPQKLPAQLL